MTFIQAIILGVVEGVTEFLPISSTGHLIITSQLLGLVQSDFLKSFEIFIQLGAILAIVVLYWRRVWSHRQLFWKVVVGFIPTGIIGLAVYKQIKQYLLGSTSVVLWSLAIGGAALLVFEWWYRKQAATRDKAFTYKKAGLIGVIQSLAVIPGVSRSAASIVGGLALGLSRETIVEFSFLLAVPTILAATGLDLIKTGIQFTGPEWGLLLVGFITAFLVSLVVVRWLINYVKHRDFTIFGVYRIVLAFLVWWLL